MDEYERKFQAALDEMQAAGIWRGNALSARLTPVRSIGLKPRPAYYVPFIKVALHQRYFSLAWFGGL